MTDSPPTNPDAAQADQAARSVQEQLDALLVQIETAEPGTVDPSALPDGFVPEAATEREAEQAFDQALAADPPAEATPADEAEGGEAKSEVESAAEQEMLAMLNQSLQGMNPATAGDAEAPPEEAAIAIDTPSSSGDESADAATAPTAGGSGDSESDMLAALNAALQDLNPDAPTDAAPAAAPGPAGDAQDEIDALLAQPPATPGPAQSGTDAGSDGGQDPQEEIDALLDQGAGAVADADASRTEPAAADDEAASTGSSTQDQIAEEIEGLLDAGASAEGTDGEPTIDDLDQMLAEEIDEDDELAGDFASVEAITAGIVTDDDGPETIEVDEHAASAAAVAAELDSQPEDALAGASGKEDPMATIAAIAETAQRNADAEDEKPPRDWRGVLERGKQRLLEACFVINWPARRFLSPEYRATLGYIALLNLFFAVATWFALILF